MQLCHFAYQGQILFFGVAADGGVTSATSDPNAVLAELEVRLRKMISKEHWANVMRERRQAHVKQYIKQIFSDWAEMDYREGHAIVSYSDKDFVVFKQGYNFEARYQSLDEAIAGPSPTFTPSFTPG
jgi:hypothetical protein